MNRKSISPVPELTVPGSLHKAVAVECGEGFAVAYLAGACLDGARLTPKTMVAWRRLREHGAFLGVLGKLAIRLVEPEFRGARAWEPTRSDAEYHALTVREKIREQMILGSQAQTAAMARATRLGWKRDMANLPPECREDMARAEYHFVEVGLLRGRIPSSRAA